MRKIYLSLLWAVLSSGHVMAQDTLLWENFNDTLFGESLEDLFPDAPSGILQDTLWYSFDNDMLPDGSPPPARPGNWFLLARGFADADSSDICAASNSWTNNPHTPVDNWLILPYLQITDGNSALLKWKSAPHQSPYYLDGYRVLVSTTTNDISAFTDTLFTAAEYLSGPYIDAMNCCNGGDFLLYHFSNGFVHGADGQYLQFTSAGDSTPGDTTAGDSARFIGVQREFSVNLSAYDDQQIYIAFQHYSTDDNLISIDDILVTENTDPAFGVDDPEPEVYISVFPNPASGVLTISGAFGQKQDAAIVEIFNMAGQLIYRNLNASQKLQIDVSSYAEGLYQVRVIAAGKTSSKKVIVHH